MDIKDQLKDIAIDQVAARLGLVEKGAYKRTWVQPSIGIALGGTRMHSMSPLIWK